MHTPSAPDPANPDSLEELLKRVVPAQAPEGEAKQEEQGSANTPPQYIGEHVSMHLPLPFAGGALAYAIKFRDSRQMIRSEIYLLTPKKHQKIASRQSEVAALASHGGRLYDAGTYEQVIDTATHSPVADRGDWIFALASHGGALYDAGLRRKIVRIFGLKVFHQVYNEVVQTLPAALIARRPHMIYALASHDGELYDAGCYKQVMQTATNTPIATRQGAICALAVHQGRLIDAGDYGHVMETHTGKSLAARQERVIALASAGDVLFDMSASGIYRTGSPRPFLATRDASLTALCSLGENETQAILKQLDPKRGA